MTTTVHVSVSPPASVTCTVKLKVEVSDTSMSIAKVIIPVDPLMAKFVPSVMLKVEVSPESSSEIVNPAACRAVPFYQIKGIQILNPRR